MSPPIRQLLALMNSFVETLEAASAEAARIIAGAVLQLEAMVTPPHVSLYHIVAGHFKSSAVRICLESGVTEILREAGPQASGGLHVRDIAAKNGQDPEKLARFIRYLATHHVYREVQPNVFANTRISSMLDTLKPSQEILADPEHKHDGTMASPFARAMGRTETLWTYYSRPEEQFRHKRFGIAMEGVQALQPPDAILKAYDWTSLVPESLVVDVGGGVGTSCLALAPQFPKLKFVVQDLEGVVAQGKELWNTRMPAALASGQVTLQVHDFFTAQPQNGAAVFLLKHILHDWSDEYCVKILTRLSDAATPATTLLLLETIVPHACHDPNNAAEDGPTEAPAPLLANYGAVNEMGYTADMGMFILFNSQERTRIHFVELLARTGWKFVAVHRQPGDSAFIQCIEAKKA
ncbi:S-adenosyl-L-methionine-dependent methyltransferase [Mycena capillaripes]|nr:S-adenosyl-L-methionine-dependent methyltransferase [Mycena capillaripes]